MALEEPTPLISQPCCNLQPENFSDTRHELRSRVVDVYHRADHPQTDSRRAAGNRIAIGLTARDNHWAQYSFQFAHEFCHALINYSNDERGLRRDRRYANHWLEESLCETASLFTLRALSRSWLIAPPYGAWRNYASLVLCIRGGTIGSAGASTARRNPVSGLVPREQTCLARIPPSVIATQSLRPNF